MRLRHSAILAGLICAGLLVTALAQAPSTSQPAQKDDEIFAALEKLAKAFNDKDAKAFAAAWSEKAEYIEENSGERLEGRKAIEADYAEALSKADQIRLEIDVAKVRRLGADVASVEGEARVLRPKQTVTRSKFLALLVKHDGAWLIDSVRESKSPPADANADFLDELAWLNGQWHHKEGDVEIFVDCVEVANGNFRTHKFQVKHKGEISDEGTLVVGYDAVKKQLRSWVFSIDGSFGEGFIDNKGDRWTIRVTGSMPSGEKTSATQILTRKDDNHFTWQVTDRFVGARALPNAPEITLTKLATSGKKED
jgi:uncharacterized protein (TIGR02246 family)